MDIGRDEELTFQLLESLFWGNPWLGENEQPVQSYSRDTEPTLQVLLSRMVAESV
jgi:hypothetical protein